jgi:hypothetical protein
VRTSNTYLLLALILLPSFSNAQVYINEIMYDLPGTDGGREWVEVYNAGTDEIDLTTFKFSEATANHTIKVVAGTATIGSGEYGIIADDSSKFSLDWPSFSGHLFDSSFSLNNSAATLTLKDSAGSVVDQVSYSSSQGAAGDGATLQKNEGNWIVALPTPGALNSLIPVAATSTATTSDIQNTASTTTTTVTTSSGGTYSSHYSFTPLSEYKDSSSFAVTAGRNRIGVTGMPLEFEAKANINDGSASYIWTWGDGTKDSGKHTKHTYVYPGEYIIVLSGTVGSEVSVSRTKVKIDEPKLVIRNVHPEYIEVENKAKNEVNLYGWSLVSQEKVFEFPQDTIIDAGSKLVLSSYVTGLNPASIKDVQIRQTVQAPAPSLSFQGTGTTTPVELVLLQEKILVIKKQVNLLAANQPKKTPLARPASIARVKSSSTSTPTINTQVATPLAAIYPLVATTSSTSAPVDQGWFKTFKLFLFGNSKQ